MNSHCLYCGKRLSFFHGKKRPYCSDVHEDRYLERESQAALGRLQDDYPAVTNQSPASMPPPLGPPKLPESFAYETVDPALFEDLDAPNASSDPEAPAAPAPLIADRSGVRAVPPGIDFRDPGEAAFPPEDWDGAPTLPAMEAAQIGLGLATFPPALPEPELVEPWPEPPAEVTGLAPLQVRPVSITEAIAARVFYAPLLSIAVPGLAVPGRQSVLAPVAARPRTTSSEPGVEERLPEPEPLRFRTLLDLHNPGFKTAKRRIVTIGQLPLDWKAIAPETAVWRSNLVRRSVAPLLPIFSHVPGISRPAVAPMGEPDK